MSAEPHLTLSERSNIADTIIVLAEKLADDARVRYDPPAIGFWPQMVANIEEMAGILGYDLRSHEPPRNSGQETSDRQDDSGAERR